MVFGRFCAVSAMRAALAARLALINMGNGVPAGVFTIAAGQFAKLPIAHLQQAVRVFEVMIVMTNGKHRLPSARSCGSSSR